jgi:hypothetical protein
MMYRFVGGASFATLPRICHGPGSRGDKQGAEPNEPTDVKSKDFKLKQRRNGGAEGDAGVEVRPHRRPSQPSRIRVCDFTRNCTKTIAFRLRPVPSLTASAFLTTLSTTNTTTRPHTMSRLAYYPTPATRRLGNFTLDACPPTSPRCLTHS